LLRTLDAGADELALLLTTLVLRKEFGETTLDGQGLLDRPSWHWPKR
jgi:hypothetical protein